MAKKRKPPQPKKRGKSMLNKNLTAAIVKHPEQVKNWAKGMRASEIIKLAKKHPTPKKNPWMPPFNQQYKKVNASVKIKLKIRRA